MIAPQAKEEFEEQIEAFYRRYPNDQQAEAELLRHSASLLAEMPGMLPFLNEHPAYAGVAFYGKLRFPEQKAALALARNCIIPKDALDALRSGRAIQVAASAKPAWDLLEANAPDVLWTAIQLCLSGRNPRTGEPITPTKDTETEDLD